MKNSTTHIQELIDEIIDGSDDTDIYEYKIPDRDYEDDNQELTVSVWDQSFWLPLNNNASNNSVTRNVRQLDDNIDLLEQNRNISGRKWRDDRLLNIEITSADDWNTLINEIQRKGSLPDIPKGSNVINVSQIIKSSNLDKQHKVSKGTSKIVKVNGKLMNVTTNKRRGMEKRIPKTSNKAVLQTWNAIGYGDDASGVTKLYNDQIVAQPLIPKLRPDWWKG